MTENNTPKLEGVVESAMKAIDGYKSKRESNKKGWIAGIAAGILTLVALSLVFWKLYQNSRKHAKIAHDRDMLIEQQAQAKVDAQVTTTVAEVNELLEKVASLGKKTVALDSQLEQIRLDTDFQDEVLASLLTWEDVDRYLERRNP